MNIDSDKNNEGLKSIYLGYRIDVDGDIDPMYIYLRDSSIDDAIFRLRSIIKEQTDCDIQILKVEIKEKPEDCIYDANYAVGDMSADDILKSIKRYIKNNMNKNTVFEITSKTEPIQVSIWTVDERGPVEKKFKIKVNELSEWLEKINVDETYDGIIGRILEGKVTPFHFKFPINSVYLAMPTNKLISDVSLKTVNFLLKNSDIDNDRFNMKQFEKLFVSDQFDKFFGDDVNWHVLMSKGATVAMSALVNDFPFKGYHFIDEVQSLKKGFGKEMIEKLVRKYKKIWFSVDVDANKSLVDYYREFPFFEEIVVEKSIWNGKKAYFFCTKECDLKKIEKYIQKTYSDEIEDNEKDK